VDSKFGLVKEIKKWCRAHDWPFNHALQQTGYGPIGSYSVLFLGPGRFHIGPSTGPHMCPCEKRSLNVACERARKIWQNSPFRINKTFLHSIKISHAHFLTAAQGGRLRHKSFPGFKFVARKVRGEGTFTSGLRGNEKIKCMAAKFLAVRRFQK
jgi:hypothetical protein